MLIKVDNYKKLFAIFKDNLVPLDEHVFPIMVQYINQEAFAHAKAEWFLHLKPEIMQKHLDDCKYVVFMDKENSEFFGVEPEAVTDLFKVDFKAYIPEMEKVISGELPDMTRDAWKVHSIVGGSSLQETVQTIKDLVHTKELLYTLNLPDVV